MLSSMNRFQTVSRRNDLVKQGLVETIIDSIATLCNRFTQLPRFPQPHRDLSTEPLETVTLHGVIGASSGSQGRGVGEA
jgi:hypothetical protein